LFHREPADEMIEVRCEFWPSHDCVGYDHVWIDDRKAAIWIYSDEMSLREQTYCIVNTVFY